MSNEDAALKISREFARRLDGRRPDEMVRAVVMLTTEAPAKGVGRRALKAERGAMQGSAKRSVAAATVEVDEILAEFGGRRLGGDLGILGGLAVESTPAGLKAMAEIPQVRAIMEDQGISLIAKARAG